MPDPLASARSTVRLFLTLSAAPSQWLRDHSGRGEPFAGDSHAVATVCQRLQDEQAFVRTECARLGLAFSLEAFWNLYRGERERVLPRKRGRRWHAHDASKSARLWVSLDVEQQRWIDQQCREGPFESPSHLVEAGLWHLQGLEAAEAPIALGGFPFDPRAFWARYREELAAVPGTGSGG